MILLLTTQFWPNGLNQYTEFVESLVTISAVILGGTWTWKKFFREREDRPAADLAHDVFILTSPSGSNLLRLTISITNIGKTLLKLQNGFVRLQKISPCEEHVRNWIESELTNNETELEGNWPVISNKKFWDIEHELEPGESDRLIFDFPIENKIEAITIYSHIQNQSKDNNIGWSNTSTHLINDSLITKRKDRSTMSENKPVMPKPEPKPSEIPSRPKPLPQSHPKEPPPPPPPRPSNAQPS